MSLKEQLHADLTSSLKARDVLRTSTLRMALAAITNEEVAGKEARQLSDDEVTAVLTRESKRRREAAEAFDQGGRPELAQRERDEGEVLSAYLPAQLTDEELTALVAEAIAETGADSLKAMGQVMKVLNTQVAGRAEGGRIAAEVRRQLDG
jgi:uncharacterized protein YqeY